MTPNFVHVFCIRYIAQNFMRRFKNNDIKKLIINIGKCQTSFSSYYISLYFVLFIILKLYVYKYSAYARIEPTFNHYYNILREEANVD